MAQRSNLHMGRVSSKTSYKGTTGTIQPCTTITLLKLNGQPSAIKLFYGIFRHFHLINLNVFFFRTTFHFGK